MQPQQAMVRPEPDIQVGVTGERELVEIVEVELCGEQGVGRALPRPVDLAQPRTVAGEAAHGPRSALGHHRRAGIEQPDRVHRRGAPGGLDEPAGERGVRVEARPERVLEELARLGLVPPLPVDRVVEGVVVDEVHAAGHFPGDSALHLLHRQVPAERAEGLREVPLAVEEVRHRRVQLGRDGVGVQAADQVHARQLVVLAHLEPAAALDEPVAAEVLLDERVGDQRDAVRRGPVGERLGVRLVVAVGEGVVVVDPRLGGRRARVVPEPGEPGGEVVPGLAAEVVAEPGGPRDRAERVGAAPVVREVVVEARLVVEDALDGRAEVPAEPARVRLVGDVDELRRGLRVEHVDVGLVGLEIRVVVDQRALHEVQQAPAPLGHVPAQPAVRADSAGQLHGGSAVEGRAARLAAGHAAAVAGRAHREGGDQRGRRGLGHVPAGEVSGEVVGEQRGSAVQ